jgi:SAM-dependent methyltransferase
MLHLQSGDTVLDLGSGAGYFSETICTQVSSTFCLDIALGNLLAIKQRNNRNVFLIHSEAEHLPFSDTAFNKVLCSEVLEHLEGDREALQEIARILQPGGTLVITVPCSELRFPTLIDLLGIKTVHDHEGPEKHCRKGYTIRDISDLLNEAGLLVFHHAYFSHFFSQLLLDSISISHLLVRRIFFRQKAWQWADIQALDSSAVFKVYKIFFPLFLLISKLDNFFFLFSRAKGYGLAIEAKKPS